MIKNRLLKKIDDMLNPLLVREVRQSLRSNVFAAGVIIVILISALCLVGNIAELSSARTSGNQGERFFYAVTFIIWFFSVIFVPVAAAHRFRTENRSREFELFHVTGISPLKTIIGKMQAALVMVLLIIFASAPFLLACYFLRGISILEELMVILLVVLCSMFCVSLGILTGCGKSTRLGALFSNFLLGAVLFVFTMFLVSMTGEYRNIIFESYFLHFLIIFALYELLIIFAAAARLDYRHSLNWSYFKVTLFLILNVLPLLLMFAPELQRSDEVMSAVYSIFAGIPLLLIISIIAFDFENDFIDKRTSNFFPNILFGRGKGAFSIWLSLCMGVFIFWELFCCKFDVSYTKFGCSFVLTYFAILFLAAYLIMKFIIRLKKIHLFVTSICAFGVVMLFSVFAEIYGISGVCKLINPFTLPDELPKYLVFDFLSTRLLLFSGMLLFWILFFLGGFITYIRCRRKQNR